MATWLTYDQVGLAESVDEIISNITPEDTPAQTLIGATNEVAKLYEWQEDSLVDVEDIAKIEGFEATEDTLAPTVMRSNYMQIISGVVKVSASSDAVKKYGRKRETAYQTEKRAKELKRALENTLVGTRQTAVAGSSGVARKMAGMQAQIHADVTIDAGTTAMSETHLLNAMEALYDEGGKADYALMKPGDGTIVASFAQASGRERDIGSGKKIVNTITAYDSPYGEVKFVMDRFIDVNDMILFCPEYWERPNLRPWQRKSLPADGDYSKGMIVTETSVKHKNYRASALIENLT